MPGPTLVEIYGWTGVYDGQQPFGGGDRIATPTFQ
jgi:hypothetical protein